MLINVDECMDYLSIKSKKTFQKYKVPYRIWDDGTTRAYDSKDLEQHTTKKSSRVLPIKSVLEKKKSKNLEAKIDMSLAQKLYSEIAQDIQKRNGHKKITEQQNLLANSLCTVMAQRAVLEDILQADPKDALAMKLYTQNLMSGKMLNIEKERTFNE